MAWWGLTELHCISSPGLGTGAGVGAWACDCDSAEVWHSWLMREVGAGEPGGGCSLGLEAQHEALFVSWWLSQLSEVMRDEGDLLPQPVRQQPEGGVDTAEEPPVCEHEAAEEQQDLAAPSH